MVGGFCGMSSDMVVIGILPYDGVQSYCGFSFHLDENVLMFSLQLLSK